MIGGRRGDGNAPVLRPGVPCRELARSARRGGVGSPGRRYDLPPMNFPIPIPPAVLDLPVEGRNLAGPRLADNLGTGARLLVFLRHLG